MNMKDGICPMCKSNEVYMSENDKSRGGSVDEVAFSAGETRSPDVYYSFDTYVCLNCGYTAMFAKAILSSIKGFPLAGSQGLSFLKKARGWKKVG
jgi:hypothetical protein